MKKTFLTRRNAILSSTDFSWGTVALGVAILFLIIRLLAPNFFWNMSAPVFRSAEALATAGHSFTTIFLDAATLARENERLQHENTALVQENATLLLKVASWNALVGTTGGGGNASTGILAGVLARPPESPYDTLIVAEGERSGVRRGMEAFGPGTVPIGIVTAVLPDFSRITLFSSPGMTFPGWVGRSMVPITITGAGAGAMNATIARAASVSIGDVVSAPGPGQLVIGKVVRVDSDPSSPSVVLRLSPATNLFSIPWVVLRDTGASFRESFLQATSTP